MKEHRAIYDQEYGEGIIIIAESNEVWSNQAGGVSCAHPEATGFYIPQLIPTIIKNMWFNVIVPSDELIKRTNDILYASEMSVDLSIGQPAMEAWLPVRLLDSVYKNGILVWENSD